MSGISTTQFVLTSSRCGGLGSYGFAYQSPEKIVMDIRSITKENLMVNANFFIFPKYDNLSTIVSDLEQSISQLKSSLPQYSEVISSPTPPYFPDLDLQLEAIWETKPTCLSFHFGIPSGNVVEKAKALGITVGMTATSFDEVSKVAQAGADFVVLQGIEAGGHRGTFVSNATYDERLSTLELLSQVKPYLESKHPQLQILVAGGIMTPRSIKDALSKGATAVQLGTIFIPSRESGASLEYKNALLGCSSPGKEPQYPSTTYTNLWSGRQAQCIPNDFTRIASSLTAYQPLPFPLQNSVTQRIRDVAKSQKLSGYQSLYAGSNYSLCREVLYPDLSDEEKVFREDELLSVKEIVQRLWK